ncbi:TPA: undecaprenyl-phosphate glucose phosphotransferase, partial [Klebsiella pneumoniae]|nr:undecaprenyl-phosphate glucose phosphotransferase [Klebsiella quasipneumoniae subsp. quasipneumoniae]
MKTFTHRARANANASLISMVQRFSDISIVFLGLYLVCVFSGVDFGYKDLVIALSVIVIFQMIGGITDFYRSWRGVKISTELILI